MLRGFALFGVLLANMYGFGADSPAWNGVIDQVAFAFKRVFFESKSWSLFAVLFGFGFALQLQRVEARISRLLFAYLRRLVVLFLLGAAHALLYDGDILMLYAEIGLGLLLVYRLPTRVLLVLAVGLMLIVPLGRLAIALVDPEAMEPPQSLAEARSQLEHDRRTHVYASGSLAEVAADNADAIPALPLEDVDSPESGLTVFAMFLLGLAVARAGILDDIPRHRAQIARARLWGLGFGFTVMAVERVLALSTGYDMFPPQRTGAAVQFAGDLLLAFGTPALAFGYAATLILAAQSPRARAFLAPLAAVGRLSLSVYLIQTLMFTTLFYGYGFAQAYQLGPAAVTLWALTFFGVQILACQLWSRYFRIGPAEWALRCLTYLQWQPLRRLR